jgi:hypothetical protein
VNDTMKKYECFADQLAKEESDFIPPICHKNIEMFPQYQHQHNPHRDDTPLRLMILTTSADRP